MKWPRPTRAGRAVFSVALALVLIGLWKAINLLTLLGFLLLSSVLFDAIVAPLQTSGLILRRRVPQPLFAGRAVTIEGNLTASGSRSDVLIVDEGPTPALVNLVPREAAGETVPLRSVWLPTWRGRHRLGPVFAVSRYPFGLIEQRRELLPGEDVIVWPATGDIHRGKLTRQLRRRQLNQSSRSRPRPERTAQQEICGLRPFRPGDSPRLIHWRTSARRGELMVREYEDVPPESLAIVVDALSPGPNEARERAISFAATLCLEWCRVRGDRLVLVVAGAEVAAVAGATGPELARELLDLLALLEPGDPRQAGELIEPLSRHVGRGGGVMLVSAGPSDLAEFLRREIGLNVHCVTADDLDHLDGYTQPGVSP